MVKSSKRPGREDLPKFTGKYRERWLTENLSHQVLARHFDGLRYVCYGKHKLNPYLYGVDTYHGQDSDRSLCDRDACFAKSDMERIGNLLIRSRNAGLIGKLMWTVDDTGWIYELNLTNTGQNEWHGYPLLTRDTFAPVVLKRFSEWASQFGSVADREAARRAALLYGFKQ